MRNLCLRILRWCHIWAPFEGWFIQFFELFITRLNIVKIIKKTLCKFLLGCSPKFQSSRIIQPIVLFLNWVIIRAHWAVNARNRSCTTYTTRNRRTFSGFVILWMVQIFYVVITVLWIHDVSVFNIESWVVDFVLLFDNHWSSAVSFVMPTSTLKLVMIIASEEILFVLGRCILALAMTFICFVALPDKQWRHTFVSTNSTRKNRILFLFPRITLKYSVCFRYYLLLLLLLLLLCVWFCFNFQKY